MKKIVALICAITIAWFIYTIFNYGVVNTRKTNDELIRWRYEHAIKKNHI